MLSYYISSILKCNSIQTICVKNIDNKEIKDYTPNLEILEWLNYLIINDLVSSWNTMQYVLDTYFDWKKKPKIASLYYNKWSRVIPDFFVSEKNKGQLLDFDYKIV